MQTVCHAKPRATCLQHLLTLAQLSIPMLASASSPRASIRMHNADLAASTHEIFPLNLGAAWPMSDAWYINPYLGVSCFVFNALKSACRQEMSTQNSVIVLPLGDASQWIWNKEFKQCEWYNYSTLNSLSGEWWTCKEFKPVVNSSRLRGFLPSQHPESARCRQDTWPDS
jgi:hypothetical protein